MDFNQPVKRVCVFGDSIAWGACDYEKGGWVERLKVNLLSNTDIDVYNFGVSGNSTIELLDRFETEVGIMKPEIIIFAIGINDTKYLDNSKTSKVGLEKFRQNILTLINIARKLTDRVMFVGLTPVDETKTMPRIHRGQEKYYENEIIRNYDLAIASICQKEKIKFVGVFEELEAFNLEDGLHPNSKGHEIIFSKVKPALEELITV